MRLRSKKKPSFPDTRFYSYILSILISGLILLSVIVPDVNAQCVAWTDNPLTSSTPIKATHVQQMRNCIDTKRVAAGLAAFGFTDPVLTAGVSVIRARHFLQIEQAVQGLYERDANWSSWFQTTYAAPLTDINLYTASPGGYVNVANLGPVNRAVSASTINTLRAAIDAAGHCGDGTCQIYNGLLATNPLALPESCGVGKCDIDCDTPCSTVNSACSGGSLACGSDTCIPGQRCQTTTCYCTTTFTCINDGACPTTCPNQDYTTGSCGVVTLLSAAVGNNRTAVCSGICTGTVTGACTNGGTFTGITDGCTVSGGGPGCSQSFSQTCAVGGGCSAPGAWNQWRDWLITQYQSMGYTDPATTFSAEFTTLGNFYNANNNCTNFGDATNTTNIVMGPSTVRLTVAWFGLESGAPGSCLMSVGGSIFNGTCPLYPGCSDGLQNGTETAIDCGGFCPACPTCSDGIKNQGEAGIDCGGPCTACSACGWNAVQTFWGGPHPHNTARCNNAGGAEVTATCDAITNGQLAQCCDSNISVPAQTGIDCIQYLCTYCAAPTCSDGIQNGTETGIDCGGSCPACAPTCSDGIQNGTETGIDCGGSCPACGSTCSDGIQNGTETGIDCGGSCPACAPTCSDGIQNGTETGIDCGGVTCPACTANCNATSKPTATCGNVTLPATLDGNVGTAQCPVGTCGTASATCTGATFGAVSDNCKQAFSASYTVAARLGVGVNGTTINNQNFTACFPSSFTVLTSSGLGCGSTGNPGSICTLWATNSCPATPSCSDGSQNYGETGVDCGGPCAAACPSCPVTPVVTGTGCGTGNLPAIAHNTPVSVPCPSGCSGTINGICNMSAYTSITNNCRGACGAAFCYTCSPGSMPGSTCVTSIAGPAAASDCSDIWGICY